MSDVRVLTEPLGGSPLSRALQAGAVPSAWIAAAPATSADWRERAEARRAETDWRSRWEALMPAIAPSGVAAARLARVQRENGIVVTTGQQPGLFGGPLYTWSKAASAIALADEIEARTGVPTAAVYWAATDDADFAEAASTTVARVGGLEVLRATFEPPAGTPMTIAPLGDLADARRRLIDASGSAADPRPLESIADSYGASETSHGDAFVRLLRAMLEPLGMAVLDASHPAIATASAPTIASALSRASDIETALAHRAREIRGAGFEPQVEDVQGLALAFVRDGTVKRRLTVAEASRANGWLTPNVLLRPVVEHAILPTVAYVAGPGELAYFAQVSTVADALGTPGPVAVPRWSCTLIEPTVQVLLDRYGIAAADLDLPDALEGQLARAAMGDDTVRSLADLRAAIASLPGRLHAESEPLGISAAVVGGVQSLQHRLDRIERRFVAAIKRREASQMRDVATLRAALRPGGTRQERVLNAIPLFARHGRALLAEMVNAARPHAASLIEPARSPRTAGAPS
ncbi:MAG TPA: bacillithiol biosynthesis BshC [Gemmatimonadaceae bacterium]|nr:bacillithiol biosynthesis BshC [Gemmatimonadaceae bacterium]